MDIINLDEITNIDTDEIVKSVLDSGDFNPTREMGNYLPYTRKASIDSIVPIDYQNRLMEVDFVLSNCYFLIGDIATDLVNSVNRTRSQELGKLISKTDIFEAVGFFCHRSARAVRFYYEAASHFPPEIRNKYDVPFNVYGIARWVKQPELLLQLASENPMWSAEKVRAEYYKQIGEEVPVRESKEVPDSGAELEQELPESTAPSMGFKTVLLSKLDHTVDDLREIIVKIPLPVSTRKRIGDVIYEIIDIEGEIRRET